MNYNSFVWVQKNYFFEFKFEFAKRSSFFKFEFKFAALRIVPLLLSTKQSTR